MSDGRTSICLFAPSRVPKTYLGLFCSVPVAEQWLSYVVENDSEVVTAIFPPHYEDDGIPHRHAASAVCRLVCMFSSAAAAALIAK